MTVQQQLLGAADMIERQGLARGVGHDDQGRVCTVAALAQQDRSNHGQPTYYRSLRHLAQHLGYAPHAYGEVMDWSDKSPQSVVVQTLREAAGVTAADPHERPLVA